MVTDPDPRRLRLRAARTHGRLDLDNLATAVKPTLLDFLLNEGITAEAAHLPGLARVSRHVGRRVGGRPIERGGWVERSSATSEGSEGAMDIRCTSHVARQEGGDPPGPRYRVSAASGDFHRRAGL